MITTAAKKSIQKDENSRIKVQNVVTDSWDDIRPTILLSSRFGNSHTRKEHNRRDEKTYHGRSLEIVRL